MTVLQSDNSVLLYNKINRFTDIVFFINKIFQKNSVSHSKSDNQEDIGKKKRWQSKILGMSLNLIVINKDTLRENT